MTHIVFQLHDFYCGVAIFGILFFKGQLISEENFGVTKVKDLKWVKSKKIKTHFYAN